MKKYLIIGFSVMALFVVWFVGSAVLPPDSVIFRFGEKVGTVVMVIMGAALMAAISIGWLWWQFRPLGHRPPSGVEYGSHSLSVHEAQQRDLNDRQ